MSNIKQAVGLILADISGLSKPAVATSVAGIAVPIIAAIAGVDVTAAELAADLAVAGGIAATLQKLTVVKTPAPVPVPAPAPVKKAAAKPNPKAK